MYLNRINTVSYTHLSVELDGVERKLTYSYNDILTKTVMLESEQAGAV